MIRVSEPALVGNERRYANDCLDNNQLTMGPYVNRLEKEFARFCGTKLALATANGTVALHLILKAMGIGPGDFVVVPNITYVATANAVAYCGATPVFVDVDEGWCMDPDEVRKAMAVRPKAIIPVHLYGLPCDMGAIMEISREFRIPLVEDAAESFGATHGGKMTGTFGRAGMFSMYSNKIIVSGEGGMIVTDDHDLYERMKLLRGQGMSSVQRYWHVEVGYNYRMTDLQAAIGLAQIEKADWHIAKRIEVAGKYLERLSGVDGLSFQPTRPGAVHVRWMVAVMFDEHLNRDMIAGKLRDDGIETRPVFPQITRFPMYREYRDFPMAGRLSKQGLCLPTHANLTDDDISYVCDKLKEAMK